ncbi:MAG: hypothetical protein WCF39_09765 [Pseudolabrys sp.]
MRMFLVGVLSVTLIGCTCPTAPQAMLETCTSKVCFYRSAASPPIEPTPFKPNRTTKKAETKSATKTAKTASVAAKAAKSNPPQTSNGSDKEKSAPSITMIPDSSVPPLRPVENAKTVGTNVTVAEPRQSSEPSDRVLEKAKTTVASKMEDPASVEFEDMNRAVRNDTFGQSIDTICGHVRGKNTSGAETGKRAFLYLVKEDIAFVDYGYPNSRAANAYRSVCTAGGPKAGIGR